MNRPIMMINEIQFLNEKSKDITQSFDILKEFIIDQSSEAFLDGEDNFFWKQGDFIIIKKHLVEKLDKSKIEIYSNEHPPAHFHFNIWNYKSSYTIEGCKKINWEIPKQYEKKMKLWYKYWWKDKLIEKWNETRPSNCTVWKIKK